MSSQILNKAFNIWIHFIQKAICIQLYVKVICNVIDLCPCLLVLTLQSTVLFAASEKYIFKLYIFHHTLMLLCSFIASLFVYILPHIVLYILRVVSDIFEHKFINSGNTEKYLTENCSKADNNQYTLNLFTKS